MAASRVVEEVIPKAAPKRKLPEDPREWDAHIAPFKLYAKTALHGLDRLHDWMQEPRYDKDEMASGELALGGYLYEAVGSFSAGGLLLAFVAATEIPRGMHFTERVMKERKAKRDGKAPEKPMGNLTRVEPMKEPA